jgi:phosphoglycolate phosphatase-like HAD superfamily hydrolase
MQCVIFDIDGTLSDTSKRNHYVRSKPRNWKAFAAAIPYDDPYEDIIWLLNLFNQVGVTVILCSGREETSRKDTEEWLEKYGVKYFKMFMRGVKDYRDDTVVKYEMLLAIRHMGFEPRMVFDDRQKVVDMWRGMGLRCLQVQPGDF